MRLHTDRRAPSPRRVHLFMTARGIELPCRELSLADGQQFDPDFLRLNPAGTVPVLELDDGSVLTEVVAICRYLDDKFDGDHLFGDTPEQRARILDADHWIEMHGLLAVMEGFRNASPGMRDRALPGTTPVAQLPELAARGVARYLRFLNSLEQRLDRQPWIVGEHFSPADITAWVTLEFAGWGIRQRPDASQRAIRAWQRRTAERLGVEAGG